MQVLNSRSLNRKRESKKSLLGSPCSTPQQALVLLAALIRLSSSFLCCFLSSAASQTSLRFSSGDGDALAEVDVLDGVEQDDAVLHVLLEGLATGNQPHAAGTLVDNRRLDGLGQIVFAGRSAGIDQALATHVAVHHLVAGEVDGMVAGEVRIDALVCLAELEGVEAAVGFGQLLLDDVGTDGDTKVVGLGGQVSGSVVVDTSLAVLAVDLESVVAQVAPENGDHAQPVCFFEGCGHFLNLASRLGRAEVDGGADGDCPHVIGLPHLTEHDLVELVGIAEEFVVVELDDERNLVGVLARHRAEHAEGRCHCVAAAFDGQFDDLVAVEVDGVLGE